MATTRNPRNTRKSPVNLTPAQKKRLFELLNGSFGQSPNLALRAVGIDEQMLRQCVSLPEGELTAADILHALADEVRAVKLVQATHGKRLDDYDENLAEIASGLNRLEGGTGALARRVAEIESVIGSEQFVSALQAGQSGGAKSFIHSLRQSGTSDHDIREALGVMRLTDDDTDDLDLSDAQAFHELATSFLAFRRTTDEALNRHGQTLYGVDGQPGLVEQVGSLEQRHTSLSQRFSEVVGSSQPGPAAWITGLVVLLVSWFLFSRKAWLVVSTGTSSGVTVNSTGELPLNNWYYQGLVAMCLGLVAMAIVWGLQRGYSRSRSYVSTTSTSAPAPAYAPVRAGRTADATAVIPPVPPAPAEVRAQVAASQQPNNA